MTTARYANVEGITWLPPGDVPFGRRGYQMLRKTSGERSANVPPITILLKEYPRVEGYNRTRVSHRAVTPAT